MNKTRMRTAFLDDALYPVLLTEVVFADVLDLDICLGGCGFGIFTDGVAQRFRKFGIIKDADAVRVQKTRHSCGMAGPRQRSGEHHPVKTRQHPFDPLAITLHQVRHTHAPYVR